MLVYFLGLLALAVVLMTRDIAFLLFAITGFFHAYQLNPWPLQWRALATSVAIDRHDDVVGAVVARRSLDASTSGWCRSNRGDRLREGAG